jgi:hypothetical protein
MSMLPTIIRERAGALELEGQTCPAIAFQKKNSPA